MKTGKNKNIQYPITNTQCPGGAGATGSLTPSPSPKGGRCLTDGFPPLGYWVLVIGCWIFSSLLLSGCEPDEEPPLPPAETPSGVYILNEGNFGSPNASISWYDPETKKAEQDVFGRRNNYPLGDVLQSVVSINNELFWVVNNSGKIEVTDPLTLQVKGSITGLESPRYIIPISDDKAYVTDIKASRISIINPKARAVTGQISYDGNPKANLFPTWTEQGVKNGHWVYVLGVKDNEVLVINSNTDAVEDTIAVGKEPKWIAKDHSGQLWVLASGGIPPNKETPKLHRIDPATRKITAEWLFDISAAPANMMLNKSGDTLFYAVNNAVYAMPVTSGSLPSQPVFTLGGRHIYGLGIDPMRHEFYAGDEGATFTTRGWVLRLSNQGQKLDSFQAGIGPAGFYFY